MPYASWVIQNVTFVQQYLSASKLAIICRVAAWNVYVLVRLMDFVLNFQVTSVLEMGCEPNQRGLHALLDTESPSFTAFNLNRKVLLEVHMPIGVVSITADESFNFSSSVSNAWLGSGARKVSCKAVPHLVEQLLTPLLPHLKWRAKVKTGFFLGVSLVSLVRIVSTVALNRCFSGLPNMQLIRSWVLKHFV